MTLSKDSELALCAPVKTAMMLLVVLYHSCVMYGGSWFTEPACEAPVLGVFAQWLNTFHVPVFVFMSGYLYAYLKGETDRYGNIAVVVSKKAKRLLVPYVFACAVWVVPFWVFFNGSDEVVSKYVLAGAPSQLWFIVMLFVLFLLFELLWKMLGRRLLSLSAETVAFAVALYCVGVVASKVLPIDVAQVASACKYACLFWAGMAFRVTSTRGFWKIHPAVPAAIHLALFALSLVVSGRDGIVFSVLSVMLWPFIRLAGIAMAVSVLGRVFVRFAHAGSRWGGVIERSSFGIYLFHQQLIYVVISLLNVPSVPPVVLASACFSISLLVSLGITVLLRRFKPTRFLIGG